MEKVYPIQKPIINFSDTLFVYKFHEGEIRHHAVTDHTLAYVYSGEMTIVNNTKTTKLYAGDCVFLSRNNKVKVSARPYNGIELKSVFLTFTRPSSFGIAIIWTSPCCHHLKQRECIVLCCPGCRGLSHHIEVC